MMEQGPVEKTIFEQSIRYKMPLPEAFKNPPVLFLGLEFYFNAFRHLSTCRVSTMTLGPITYFDCVHYCEINDIIEDQREDFIVVIMALDVKYLEYINKKKPKPTK